MSESVDDIKRAISDWNHETNTSIITWGLAALGLGVLTIIAWIF